MYQFSKFLLESMIMSVFRKYIRRAGNSLTVAYKYVTYIFFYSTSSDFISKLEKYEENLI